jgi:ADP-ribosyl-[dinitrogen reductase] hydrolase
LLIQIESVLLGLSVGDALGVPVEFRSREYIKNEPVEDMIGYGTYYLPPGTWSDDSSLSFCLAEAIADGYTAEKTAGYFVRWLYDNFWTARDHVFDVGIATRNAINLIDNGTSPTLAGGNDEYSNGNGSLMRIAPLVFYLADRSIEERFAIVKEVSSLTHRHIRSVIACFYYIEFMRQICSEIDKHSAYKNLQRDLPAFLACKNISENEITMFNRLLKESIDELPEEKIQSGGYVVHTLEAAIWCLLTTDSYSAAVLKSVNLGDDADSTGTVTGALAGLLYGKEAIPSSWLTTLARTEDISDLAKRMADGLRII